MSSTPDEPWHPPEAPTVPIPLYLAAGVHLLLGLLMGLALGLASLMRPELERSHGLVAEVPYLVCGALLASGFSLPLRRRWSWWIAVGMQGILIPLLLGLSLMTARSLSEDGSDLVDAVRVGVPGGAGLLSLTALLYLIRRRTREAYGVLPHRAARLSRRAVVAGAVLFAVLAPFVYRYGMTRLLWEAVEHRNPTWTRLLLRLGANPEGNEGDGELPLMFAARYGMYPVCEALLQSGARVNVQRWGWTPFQAARGREMQRLMLRYGADPASGDRHNTALLGAIYDGDGELVQILLRRGADPNMLHEDHSTVLMNILRSDSQPEALPALLDSERLKVRGRKLARPLFRAALSGDQQETRRLLRQGADPNARDAGGFSALMGAAALWEPAMVRLLLDAGADLNARDCWGRTPLMWAAVCNQPQVIRLLLDRGAPLETRDRSNHEPALLLGAEAGSLDAVRVLLERGADLNARGSRGCSAASLAKAAEAPAVESYLRNASQRSRRRK